LRRVRCPSADARRACAEAHLWPAERSWRTAVDQIADQLKCSKSALLIRFEELGLINAEQRRSKMRELSLRSMPTGGGRSSRTSVSSSPAAPLLTELVFRAYSRDQLGAVEAARLLNTSPANLQEVGQRLATYERHLCLQGYIPRRQFLIDIGRRIHPRSREHAARRVVEELISRGLNSQPARGLPRAQGQVQGRTGTRQ